jgi:undecaprenyl-diphosphatase
MNAKRKLARNKKTFLTSFSVLMIILLTYLFFHTYENFHTIIPNKIYRSAELTHQEFIQRTKQKGLKSVVNLRGENEQYGWYRAEEKTLKSLGVHLYNFRLSSYHLPPQKILQDLAITLETAPKPLLIHCASGVDRTGLASAMVILLHGGTLEQARRQISLLYGDIMPSSAGKLFLRQYILWLKQQHLNRSTAKAFKTWLGIDKTHESLQLRRQI